METAKFFLNRDVQSQFRTIQKNMFDLIDGLRASDADNLQALKDILGDDELANRFLLFQEHRAKAIRKQILDTMGDASRHFQEVLQDYDVKFNGDIELKGIVK